MKINFRFTASVTGENDGTPTLNIYLVEINTSSWAQPPPRRPPSSSRPRFPMLGRLSQRSPPPSPPLSKVSAFLAPAAPLAGRELSGARYCRCTATAMWTTNGGRHSLGTPSTGGFWLWGAAGGAPRRCWRLGWVRGGGWASGSLLAFSKSWGSSDVTSSLYRSNSA